MSTWVEDAELYVAALAATNQQFTVDEVWEMLDKHSEHEIDNAKAMGGVMQLMGARLNVIAPLAAWQTSARAADRPIRLFCGTGKTSERFDVTEENVLWALQAIERVNQVRSQLMMESIRKARGGT